MYIFLSDIYQKYARTYSKRSVQECVKKNDGSLADAVTSITVLTREFEPHVNEGLSSFTVNNFL